MLCPRCQRTVDPGAAFCGNCGFQLAQPASPPAPTFYQPPQLAQPAQPVQPVQPVQPWLPSEAAVAASTPAPWPTTASPAPPSDHSGQAIASFVLAVLGLPACLIPIVGVVFGILAIVFGTLSIRSARRVFAIIGMSLAVLVLLASIFLWVHNTQQFIQQRRSGTSPVSSTASGPLQSIATPCYSTKIPAGLKLTQTPGSCTFVGIDAATGEQIAVKVLTVPQLTLSNLATAAKADAANVVGAIPGGSISSQRSATFAESQAYELKIKATDGSAGTLSYVYDTTAQGNLVIVLHTQARATATNYDLTSIEANWSWL